MEIISKVAEGGQTWAHRVKMVQQVLKSAFIWAFLTGLIAIGYLQYREPKTSYQALYYWSKAKLFSNKKTIQVDPDIWKALKQGSKQVVLFAAVSVDDPDHHPSKHLIRRHAVLRICQKRVHVLVENFRVNLKKAGIFSLAAFAFALLYFFFRGKRSRQKKHLSGIRLESARKLKYKAYSHSSSV
ncbi:MAG: hypothetical protein AAF443_05200 [Chlamydiota bacterium]